MARERSTRGLMVQRGFRDAGAAAAIVDAWGEKAMAPVIDAVARCADPDDALTIIDRLLHEHDGLLEHLTGQEGLLGRLAAVVGAGTGFHQHLIRVPEAIESLSEEPRRRSADEWRRVLVEAIGAPGAAEEGSLEAADPQRSDDLRRAYHTGLMQIAARDLTHPEPTEILEEITAEIADLADATVHAALCLARGSVKEWEACRLGVVALGKCGAQELNYASDVDVLYVAEPAEGVDPDQAMAVGAKVAGALATICSAHTGAGTIWPLDAGLRPEGKAGPLVRTVTSHETYYLRWAKNWEFQAMLKARPMAGDLDLAGEFCDMIAPMVWKAASKENFVSESQAMRRRVIDNIPAKHAGREIKLGAGGLRDVEFTVQLLQLVHGRADERLRSRATLTSLENLISHGYVNRADGAEFADAYRWERLLEHRGQLTHLRRTHLLPEPGRDLDRIARGLRMEPKQVTEVWRSCSRRVLSLHKRIYYSPLLEAVARIPSAEVRLTTEAARERLAALGYDDPRSALGHIEALTRGVSRQAEIQRQLLPAMLGWFAEGANPDHALLAFRQVSEALGTSPWYLRGLRDEGAMAERLARMLTAGRYLVDLIQRAPQSVQILSKPENLRPLSLVQLRSEMRAAAALHDEVSAKISAVRALRRRELLRIGAGDLLGYIDLEQVGAGLTDVASAVLDVALEIVMGDDPIQMAVIALGRWGGGEMSYASDADALIVLGDDAPSDRAAKVIEAVRRELRKSVPGVPPLTLDLDLRPEGRDGPLVRTLGSYRAYYARWGETWEQQALLRAAHGAGDEELSERFLEQVRPLRWPADLTDSAVQQIRRLKARMESERLPRGIDRKRHLKLGPGGLADVEWTVQLIQLRHAHAIEGLRTTRTLPALAAALEAGLVEADDAEALEAAWRLASRVRDRVMMVRGKDADVLPQGHRDLAAVSMLLTGETGASHLIDHYHRRAFQARRVVELLFWEDEE